MRWMLALLLAVTPVHAGAPDHRAFTIPWGTDPTSVARDAATTPAREWAGPASVRLAGNGDVLVVDTRAHRVLRFAPDGRPVAGLQVPAATEHDAERAIVDVAEDAGGDLFVLELAERVLLRFGADGASKDAIAIPAGPDAILTAVAAVGPHLAVFDAAENRIVRVDREGRKLDVFGHDLVQGLAPDGTGKWLGLELASPGSARGFKVWRVDPASGAKEAVADVADDRPVVEAHLLGADRAGRVYVEVAYGAVEKPSGRQVRVIAGGRSVGSIEVPPRPVAFKMLNARVVLPEGGLLTASDGARGLEIRPHPFKE